MKTIKVFHYDAFSKVPGKGNPAGVVFNGEYLTEAEMQKIALEVGYNETAFPLYSSIADLRIRFFTPGHEIDLCGHATMASIYGLKKRGLLRNKEHLLLETKAGILPITIKETEEEGIQITMRQAAPQFQRFNGSIEELAKSIGLTKEDIHEELPILYGSTGTWTLVVPIRSLEVFQKMKPNNDDFPDVLQELPHASIHPFCLEAFADDAHMHARHFSSPHSGTVEDAVTGTASGVLGAYYATYIQKPFEQDLNVIVEQGQEMNKDGRVFVRVIKEKENFEIEITGHAVYVKNFEVSIPNELSLERTNK